MITLVDNGGVCTKFAYPERRSTTNDNFDILYNLEDYTSSTAANHQDKVGVSRNTGFVSFTHQGTDVPDIVSKLAFLHEIGHSLGSPVSLFLPINLYVPTFT